MDGLSTFSKDTLRLRSTEQTSDPLTGSKLLPEPQPAQDNYITICLAWNLIMKQATKLKPGSSSRRIIAADLPIASIHSII